MKKAALYARVSSELQKEEHTIESQISELKRQIVEAGHVLVKEYIDEGYTGTRLDRPAMEQMREDLKTTLFDVIYFLTPDRIARQATHQGIIIGDILKYKKRLVVDGKDYEHNPENHLQMTIQGAVSEYERAKIVERTTRGRMHRIRMGQVVGQGSNIFGYNYIKKSPTSPPALVINEKEAKVVQLIFDLYANAKCGMYQLPRSLEEKGILTRKGKSFWRTSQIRRMLQNQTYTGVKYFNTMYREKVSEEKIRKIKYGKMKLRDQSEWLAVKVPAIISQELFDKAQERMQHSREKYRQPFKKQLLSGLIECGECRYRYASYRRRVGVQLKIGIRRIYHKTAYACSWGILSRTHYQKLIKRCKNPEIITSILERKIFAMMKEYLTDPLKLKNNMEFFKNDYRADQKRVEWRLMRIDRKVKIVEVQKKRLIDQYAIGKITQENYVNESIALDQKLHKIQNRRAELIDRIPLLHNKEIVEMSMKQFCTSVKIRLEQAEHFQEKRELLTEVIEKIIYKPYHVTITGSVPIKLSNGDEADQVSRLPFRMESQIERTMVYGRPRMKYPEDGRLMAYGSAGRFKIISRNPLQRIRLPVGPMGPRKRKKVELVTA